MPRSTTRVSRDGNFKFVSNVDRAQYTLQELTRAALRDVAKLLRKRLIIKLKKLSGMKRHRRLYSSTQYWVRRKEADLQIGFKHDSWYGAQSELGTNKQPARHILRSTVMESINDIQVIEGKYLSAIENENKAMGLINDDEFKSPKGEE